MQPALGVLLNAEYPLSELVELGCLSERLGYRYFWYVDDRFLRECYLGLAVVAAKTERILLGPGVTDPYTRHPAITAATVATLDELCGGRALLGLGVGAGTIRSLAIQQPLPVAALRESVEVVRRLLRGEQVTMHGKVISLTGQLKFAPVRDRIPIYFATHGAQITRLAGEVADGVLLANIAVPSAFAWYLERLQEGLAKAGRPQEALDVCLRLEACISDDEEAAFGVMRRRVAARLVAGYPHWEYLERLNLEMPQAFVDVAADRERRSIAEAAAALPPEAVERMVLAGRPERVAEQVAEMLRPEITQLTIRPHPVPGHSVAAVLRAFAQQVMPRVQQLRAHSPHG